MYMNVIITNLSTMKNPIKLFSFLIVSLTIMNTSCRKEESEFIGTSPEQGLEANSNVANLLFRTSLKDGSEDNILDLASCFSIKLPVTVLANNTELTIEKEEDLDQIELIFEESDDDTDTLEIVFPITIVFSDYTEADISNEDELEGFAETCPEENAEDEDIECIDIQYPIDISTFDSNTELFDNISLENDEELNDFIEDLDDNDVVTIDFPIVLVLTDGVEIEVNDLDELENTIENLKDSCDEDDDNDFYDDNCNECTIEQLEAALTSCANFVVNKFSLNGENLKNQYDELSFNFQEDGSINVNSDTETFSGTWSATGIGNDIVVVIEITGLDDFNLTWNLNRILATPGVNKVTLRLDNDNVLRFQDTCNENTGVNVNTALQDGSWGVSSYFDGTIERASDFSGYALTFNTDGTVIADNGSPTNGTWSLENGNTQLVLDFGASSPFDQLNINWRIDTVSDNNIELSEIGTGDKLLALQKQ